MKVSILKEQLKYKEIDFYKEVGDPQDFTCFFGRSENCFVTLSDRKISREHLKLSFKNHNWSIKEVSDNPLMTINGMIKNEALLQNNDVIQLGPFRISILFEKDKEKTENIVEKVEEKNEEDYQEPSEDESPDESKEVSETNEEKDDSFETSFSSSDNEYDNYDDSQNEEAKDDEYSESSQEGDDNFEDQSDDYNEMAEFSESETDDKTDPFGSFIRFELKIEGEFAPFENFILGDGDFYIGRDKEKCKIALEDPEASGVHALIKKKNISVIIEDQNSGNGTLLNGARINSSELTDGDEFKIGTTLFKLSAISDLIKNEEDRLMPVEENQVIEIEEVVEVDSSFEDDEEEGDEYEESTDIDEVEEKSFIKKILKDPDKRKKFLIGVVAFLGLVLLLPEDEPSSQKAKKKRTPATSKIKKKKDKDKKSLYSKEQKEFLEGNYLLSQTLYEQGKYRNAIRVLESIFQTTKGKDYKNAKQIRSLAKRGLAELEEIERKRKVEEEKRIRMKKVQDLVEKAKEAVKEKQVSVAATIFNKILELDPENYDVPQLKAEIDSWNAEIRAKEAEESRKMAERSKKVSQLQPGKTFYLKQNWYKAIKKLEEFLKIDYMDEDLVQEASKMLAESKRNLDNVLRPLIRKAERMKEARDLKSAYKIYNKILDHNPENEKALNEMGNIRDDLFYRARRIYREALIDESLSFFKEAKEKFEDVKEMAPVGSPYFIKAKEKLKNYID